jgi:hypothetical protein
MNYIKHLTGFFDKVTRDDNLNPTHISLYVSLFQFWNVQRFKNPISISRDEVMRVSKICSKATYHKCMKDLHNFSYLHYDPSFNPYRGSLVTLFNLEQTHQQVQKKVRNDTKILPIVEQALNQQQTSAEQALVPYTNNSNLLNNLNSLNECVNTLANSQNSILHEQSDTTASASSNQRKKVAQKKEMQQSGAGIKPSISEVLDYFAEKNWPAIEGQKFFNHYQSNGWLVGGKTPMQNWEASANNWIINSEKYDKTKNLTATTNKNYNEPL